MTSDQNFVKLSGNKGWFWARSDKSREPNAIDLQKNPYKLIDKKIVRLIGISLFIGSPSISQVAVKRSRTSPSVGKNGRFTSGHLALNRIFLKQVCMSAITYRMSSNFG